MTSFIFPRLGVFRSLLGLLAVAMVVALGACTTDDAEDVDEEFATNPEVASCDTTQNPGLPTPTLTDIIPVDAYSPSNFSAEDSRPYFDVFSWLSFIALNGGGSADGSPVWLTYRTANDLFPATGAPQPWADGPAPPAACASASAGQTVFTMTNKTDGLDPDSDELAAVNEAFAGPLVDQNGELVYYEIRYNEPMYEDVRTNGYYIAANQPAAGLTLPASVDQPNTSEPQGPGNMGTVGSMMIKAAWKVLGENDSPDRFYTIEALIVDPITGDCTSEQMGLVGLHIAQKTQKFGPWIWSTFEQVDNVNDGTSGQNPNGHFSFNDGTTVDSTQGYDYKPAAIDSTSTIPTTPVNVTRVNAIPETPASCSTVALNQTYRNLLSETVWTNYQLVMTQWPSDPSEFSVTGTYPAGAGQPFPLNGVANATMETYFQDGNSCMACHYSTVKTDFSWGLSQRARQ